MYNVVYVGGDVGMGWDGIGCDGMGWLDVNITMMTIGSQGSSTQIGGSVGCSIDITS